MKTAATKRTPHDSGRDDSGRDDDDQILLWSIAETGRRLGGLHRQTIVKMIERGELQDRWVGSRHMILAASARTLAKA